MSPHYAYDTTCTLQRALGDLCCAPSLCCTPPSILSLTALNSPDISVVVVPKFLASGLSHMLSGILFPLLFAWLNLKKHLFLEVVFLYCLLSKFPCHVSTHKEVFPHHNQTCNGLLIFLLDYTPWEGIDYVAVHGKCLRNIK